MASPPRSRSTLIVVLLVATLSLTAMLAYEAHQSARSHREAAENVLRDYSKFAAWELSRLGRTQLLNVVQTELAKVQSAAKKDALASVLGSSAHCRAGCGAAHQIQTVFSMPLPDGAISSAGEPLSPDATQVIRKAAANGLRKPKDFTCPALAVATVDGRPMTIVWRPVHADDHDVPSGLVGFVADVGFTAHVFEKLLRTSPLLPPSLMPEGTNPNAALSIRVTSPNGTPVFASGGDWSPYHSEASLSADLGGLTLAAALRSEAAQTLVIGGLPRERLPLVVGLLTLTAGLVVVALVQLRREAELSRMRSEFVSGISHELRTPLAQIRMFTETLLLGRVRTATEGRRSLEIISRETGRLIQLVENVLLFSRGERQSAQIARERARVAPIVADVVESFAPLAVARDSRITTDLDQTVSADVDSGAIRQILLNLLDNAVKYGPADQRIHVALTLSAGAARLTVEDEGPGVEAADAERIWRPFTRLAKRNAATGGAGIGLSIVRQLAELHGGRAFVEPGTVGARFVVEIPGATSEAGALTAVA